ncbi:hypothetical protein GM3708_1223 [Geminocystis sp. NIES-3708]|uniref:CRISPR-associated protein Cas5 n=1 Tax=Geminocystis sp. NIES-3708 TaxID=1615909 RepID=UPI0005FC8B81|nr:CRISPR-associated protein Cas5 [Geminocystis sp. NIES-3708]BAQ60817.1 hypothetical protein GM3708_1223 [Geminocystis sp. NIES-3708]
MIFLSFKAPFASFRPFQSGSYRSTTPIPSPSTVYGILLNLAGIELRDDINKPISNNRQDLPSLTFAIALPSGNSEKTVLSQQLHNYPVGNSGKELAEKTYGNKYWIAPVRREVLINHRFIVAMKGCLTLDHRLGVDHKEDSDLSNRIIQGLNGELQETRYGLPFAGDNNFLFDSIEIIEKPLARWFYPLEAKTKPNRGVCRLTTWVDREDNTKTSLQVFSPTDFCSEPPEKAWITLPIIQ